MTEMLACLILAQPIPANNRVASMNRKWTRLDRATVPMCVAAVNPCEPDVRDDTARPPMVGWATAGTAWEKYFATPGNGSKRQDPKDLAKKTHHGDFAFEPRKDGGGHDYAMCAATTWMKSFLS